MNPELEFLKSLWGLGTEEEEGYRTPARQATQSGGIHSLESIPGVRSFSRPEKLWLKIHTGSSGTVYSYWVEKALLFPNWSSFSVKCRVRMFLILADFIYTWGGAVLGTLGIKLQSWYF